MKTNSKLLTVLTMISLLGSIQTKANESDRQIYMANRILKMGLAEQAESGEIVLTEKGILALESLIKKTINRQISADDSLKSKLPFVPYGHT